MQQSVAQVEAESGEVQSQHLAGSGVAEGPVTGGHCPALNPRFRAHQGCSYRNTHVLKGGAKTTSEQEAGQQNVYFNLCPCERVESASVS